MDCVMNTARALALASLALSFGCGDSGQGDAEDGGLDAVRDEPVTIATVAQGKLQGDDLGGSVQFLKIPYAKPPVGALRWAAPEPPEPWEGLRHEDDFAVPCPQGMSRQSVASSDEDCLYLNVWRPKEDVEDAPVMLWIHGGGFSSGSAGDFVPTSPEVRWHTGEVFAERHGIVVVSLNYRLGALGFLSHPALAEGAAGGEGSAAPGNQGLLDQQQALRWIRDNIAAFGGDAENVTIFGQSAGAGAVCIHMVSPGSRGLFHRAIGQSGTCRGGPDSVVDGELTEALWAWSDELGCPRGGDEGVLTCLRGLPTEDIVPLEASDRLAGMTQARPLFRVRTDGEGGVLPRPALDLFADGEVADVPYILGTTHEESRLYLVTVDTPTTDEAYLQALEEDYGDFAQRVYDMYPPADFGGDHKLALGMVRTDAGAVCSTYEAALLGVDNGLEMYVYNFNIPWSIARDVLGACHTSEVSHVFGTPYLEDENPESLAVAEAMNAHWAQFARTGDPNGELTDVAWARFDPEGGADQYMEFATEIQMVDAFRRDRCLLWREYREQQ